MSDSNALDHLEQDVKHALDALSWEQDPTLRLFTNGYYSPENFTRFGLCLIIEAAEFINETPWKIWNRREYDSSAMLSEFADFMLFIGSMVGLLKMKGISPDDLAKAITQKATENRRRFNTDGSHGPAPDRWRGY